MDLHVLGANAAEDFEPKGKTAIIRIQVSKPSLFFEPLERAAAYAHVFTYTFDDVTPFTQRSSAVRFTSAMADAVLDDIGPVQASLDALVVHCSRGVNRSPAIAAGLAQTYGFADPAALMHAFPDMNYDVYRTLVQTAAKRGLLKTPPDKVEIDWDDFQAFQNMFFNADIYRWLRHAKRTQRAP